MLLKSSVATAAIAALLLVLAPGFASSDVTSANLTRALDAYTSLRRYFAEPDGRYLDVYPGTASSSAWSLSQALAATLSLAQLRPGIERDVRDEVAGLRSYWQGAAYAPYPSSTGREAYYTDDNEWIGEDLVAAYRLLGDRRDLGRAERIFAVVSTSWDRDRAHVCPGGVYWTDALGNNDRNTVSTANGALLALSLYAETRMPTYLHWARTMDAWVERCLAAPDGLYWDHVRPAGAVDTSEWSYNQGAMIALAVGLYEAGGGVAYLERARALANASLARFSPTDFAGQPAVFVAIFFRDLARLDTVAPDPRDRAAAQRYADRLWTRLRDPRTGLLSDGETASLLDQAAVVDLYAELARG